MVDAVCCSFSCLSHPLSFGGSARLPSPASRRCDKVARSLDLDQSLVDCFSLSGRACESGETVDPVVTGGTQTDGTRKDVEGSSLVIGEKKKPSFFLPAVRPWPSTANQAIGRARNPSTGSQTDGPVIAARMLYSGACCHVLSDRWPASTLSALLARGS